MGDKPRVKLVRADDLSSLERKMNEHADQGYQVVGSIGYHGLYYVVIMTLPF